MVIVLLGKTVLNLDQKIKQNLFSTETRNLRFLCSITVATIVVNHLNSARNLKLKEKPLHVLLYSGM